MCTVSIAAEPNGNYCVVFNRDEQRYRAQGIPPQVHDGKRCRYVAPLDAESGGTWFAVNTHGLMLCLLNYYPDSKPHPKTISRGTLIPQLMDCTNVEAVDEQIRKTPLLPFRAFTLIGIDPSLSGGVWEWHENRLSTTPLALPFMHTSSSWKPEAVRSDRKARWLRAIQTDTRVSELFSRFQAIHRGELEAPSDPAYGIWMERPETRTVSILSLEHREGVSRMTYATPEGTPHAVTLC